MVTMTSVSLNNSMGIITLKDNLVHKYFTSIRWEKDNNIPTGYARAKMPYNKDILQYWSTYDGVVVIHAQLSKNKNNNPSFNNLPNTSLQTKSVDKIRTKKEKNKIKIINKEYNYSFIGHIHTVKQVGQNIIINFMDLGWKFSQKVPIDFRKVYIAGQTLDIAFQAICEFIGVDFAYSIEKLSEYNFSIDGYSIEKDGTIIETVPDMLSEYKRENEEVNDDENNEEDSEEKKQLRSHTFKKVKDPSTPEEKQLAEMQQKNQKTISNLSKNNLNDDEEKEKQQEEFDDKIKDLFIGNTIYDSNVTDAILNYDAITVEPKAVSSSEITATGTPGDLNNNNNNNGSGSSSFDWGRMSSIVRRYFNRNNPNYDTIVQAFRSCGNNWDCLAAKCNQYRQYRNTSNIDQIVREARECFK